MALKLITPASVLPVSVAEVKLSCRIDGAELDADIADMIQDAARLVSHETGQSLTEEVWELAYDCFPPAFELTRVPVANVVSLKYIAAGSEQTLVSTAYALDSADLYGPHYVVPAVDASWPSTDAVVNAVRLRYTAGYADAATVPGHLRRQVKINVAMMLDDPLCLADRLAAIDKIYSV